MNPNYKIELRQPLSFHQLGRRSNQEDARYPDTDYPDPSQRIFVVCDGVGGRDKGEVASATVAQAIGEYTSGWLSDQPFTADHFNQMMMYVYKRLAIVANESNSSMATTLAFVCFNTCGCFVAHIGDSAVYQARPGSGIIFHTVGHSLVNDLVHSGIITPEEAEDHPRRNVITRCIMPLSDDVEPAVATTVTLTDIKPGDVFMLCSDGVEECFTHDMLDEMLADPKASLMIKARNIAGECASGSNDNNTAILIEVKEVGVSPAQPVAATAPEGPNTVALPPEMLTDTVSETPITTPDTHDATRDGGKPAQAPASMTPNTAIPTEIVPDDEPKGLMTKLLSLLDSLFK